MDRVRHHGVVHQLDADPFVVGEADRIIADGGELLPIERPHIAFHIARQMDFHLAGWWTRIGARLERDQIVIGQHAMIDLIQANAGIPHPVDRIHRHHVDARPDFHIGW